MGPGDHRWVRLFSCLCPPQGTFCPLVCVMISACAVTPIPAPLPPPQALALATVTPRTIRLTWQPSAGATQYLVRCSPASPKGEEEDRQVCGREGWEGAGRCRVWGEEGGQGLVSPSSLQVRVRLPEVLLDDLEPSRDYVVWVQSLRGTEASEARGVQARTRECPLLGHGTPVPQAFHGVDDPRPHLGPPTPGHHPSFPHSWGAVAAGP